MRSDCAPATLATAVAGRHLGFCGRRAAAWRRAAAGRLDVPRVLARTPSVCNIDSRIYAPLVATTMIHAPRLALTLAPSIRIDLHSPDSATVLAPPRSFEVASADSVVGTNPPLRRATTVLRVPQPAPDRSESDPARPGLAPLLRQVIERRHREKLSVVTHAIASVRRSEVRRLETIVRQPPAPAATPRTDFTPASPPHPEPRAGNHWPSRPATVPTLAAIPDAEVGRLTERVVQQINRRILAERERRGR
jgi:hypothetical protein